MTAYGLTLRQRDTLDFIIKYTAEHRISPSFADIMAGVPRMPASRSTVHTTLCELRARGYVDWIPARTRSLIVLGQSFTLPPRVLAKLHYFCLATGELPIDVIADAVSLHLDELALEAAA